MDHSHNTTNEPPSSILKLGSNVTVQSSRTRALINGGNGTSSKSHPGAATIDPKTLSKFESNLR
jgi:hypothetical protein